MARPLKLFQFIQEYFRVNGIDSKESNKICSAQINWKKWIFFISEAQITAGIMAFITFDAKSMLEYGATFYAILHLIFAVVLYTIYSWKIENCLQFIENCERFIEKRKRSIVAYNELNEKIELFCKAICFTLFTILQLMLLSVLSFSIVNFYIFDRGDESFYLVFPVVLPFNWKTPLGYPLAWLSQFAAGCTTFSIEMPFYSFIVGSCWLFIFIADDITADLAAFNKKGDVVRENRVKKAKRFCDIVKLYSDAKQCIIDFNGIYEYAFFAFFVWELLCICCTLLTFQFQLLDDNTEPIEIVITLIFTCGMFVLVLIICEAGERVTKQFEMFGKEFEQCNWYKLTIKMQQMYMIFLLDTQQSIRIQSYGGIQCTRDTFKNTVNTGFSYFMALRQIKA